MIVEKETLAILAMLAIIRVLKRLNVSNKMAILARLPNVGHLVVFRH